MYHLKAIFPLNLRSEFALWSHSSHIGTISLLRNGNSDLEGQTFDNIEKQKTYKIKHRRPIFKNFILRILPRTNEIIHAHENSR